jgi:DNA (cytosine-5)-methyltransferase 1
VAAHVGPRIGELFAGYGGLGLGVQQVVGGEVAWFSEFDAAPSKILAHHWPTVPNHGDITKIDWSTVEPVDILTGGFPCQDVSLAGARAGFTATSRSGLWSEFARAIEALKPGMVVIENVRGLLSATANGPVEPDPWGLGDGTTGSVVNALGAVLGDLASLGYDADWCGVRAADAGAPHGRYRVFIVATDASSRELQRQRTGSDMGGSTGSRQSDEEQRERLRDAAGNRGSVAPYAGSQRGREGDDAAGLGRESADRAGLVDERSPRPSDIEWGTYRPAINRWESVLGRQAPPATNGDGKHGAHRLSSRFVEWMMGLPAGHVTNPAIGLTRNEQLKALGNGVVPQQASLALTHLLSRELVPA